MNSAHGSGESEAMRTTTDSLSPVRTVATNAEDAWLDSAAITENSSRRKTTTKELWHEFFTLPAAWFRRFLLFLKTTAGKMTLMLVILSIAIIAAGTSMSQLSAQRRADLDTLINKTEPVSHRAHNLYTSLAQADTTATVGFVQTGEHTDRNRKQYMLAYQEASRAATDTAAGLTDTNSEAMAELTTIMTLLPTYTGLVDTAWANNRQGNPISVAYMAEANTLMRTKILPAANRLYDITNDQVVQSQRQLSTPLWIPISGLLAALFFIIIAQIWLAKVTHRRLNKGFVVATVLLLIATSWVIVSNALTWRAGSKAYEQAAEPLDQLTNAQILAQQARTKETLALVQRQSASEATASFTTASEAVGSALQALDSSHSLVTSTGGAQRSEQVNVDNATQALNEWRKNHEEVVAAVNEGNYDYALELTIGTPSQNSDVSAYETLDKELNTLADDARATMISYIGRGIGAFRFINLVVFTLAILAVLSMWIGIRKRLQEYI